MKVIDPGHVYLAESVFDIEPLRVQFVKNRGPKYPGNTGEPQPGIICQELLRILIDRTAYLNSQGSCAETEHALAALRSALGWYEVRAARCRGEHIDLPHADSLELKPTCEHCGHNCCARTEHDRKPGTWRL
jgi:hypothetical protein